MSPSDGRLLLRLPVVYAVALALRDAGLGIEDIALRIDVPAASMPALLEIAHAKLSAARRSYADADEEADHPSF